MSDSRILGDVTVAESAGGPVDSDNLVTVWPHLLFRELLAVLLALIVLIAASVLFDAPLEHPADPAHTPSPAKAPWYFVGLQELLTYFDPWIAGVVLPVTIIFGLCAIPYLDPTRNDQGVYTLRRRPLASALFLAGTVGWFALIAIGLWFRGAGWAWVWPWESVPAGEAAEATRSLPNAVGIPLLIAYFGGGGAWIVRRTSAWPGFTRGRRWVFALLLLAMAGTLIKILLRLALGIRYIVSLDGVGLHI